MRNKIGIILMVVGAGLLLCAVGFLIYNLYDERRAARESTDILAELGEALPDERSVGEPDMLDLLRGSEMPTVMIKGQAYIGELAIPSQGLVFPVMSEWSYPRLKIAPCRYKGSLYDDSLIIAAHNYRKHFGGIGLLKNGDLISFTDVNGNVFHYRVVQYQNLAPTAVEEMEAGDWDLTLFTCTIGGKNRVTIRCERVQDAV